MLLSEQQEQGVIDLRPGEGATWLVRENRNLMIGRVKHLERYGLATELEPGRWHVSDRAEQTLQGLGARSEVIKSTTARLPPTASPRSEALANSPFTARAPGKRLWVGFWPKASPGTRWMSGSTSSSTASMAGSITSSSRTRAGSRRSDGT